MKGLRERRGFAIYREEGKKMVQFWHLTETMRVFALCFSYFSSSMVEPGFNSAIDHSSPYEFIGSTDHPNFLLINTPFDGNGFNSWKRSVIISLSAKNKLGWLLNSLSKNITESVLFLQIASEIWNELNQRYEQSNGALLYQIQQQIFSISQGSEKISSYFTKLTKVWDELRLVQNFPPCSCESAVAIHKFLEEQCLIQLLMGLNDSYKIHRGQILMMKPLPNVSTAYSLIIQKEQQRGITNNSQIHLESIVMHVSLDVQHNKKQLVCNHCKKNGHTKSQCYRLIGFPSNLKFTKAKKEESKSMAQNVTVKPDIGIIEDQ
ncbi:uncharacterized protein LOC111893794 [Lactuca sativa]|uniref:uncharacterized protein LOC111893794 n=1 Tax=Lactuca sativa TaxID=4236 RepID=UPI0022AF37DD|nr:uncharacterized protein LOC111893794 [Lactuca sativa]